MRAGALLSDWTASKAMIPWYRFQSSSAARPPTFYAYAARKLPYLALRTIEKKWIKPRARWKQAASQFVILFGERFTNALD